MNFNLLLNKLGKMFPKKYAKMNHDYVGLMCGAKPNEVHKILLALDCDWELMPYIKKYKPDVIFTHHPFIYGTKSRVFKKYPSKKELYDEMLALNIPVYSFHTNFDTGKDGMNDALSEKLNLVNIYQPEKLAMMRIGNLKEPMEVEEFAEYAKHKFNVDYCLLINCGKKMIKKVGIVGGGGGGLYNIAKDEGCDIYISGDAPHHVRREIVNDNYNYLDMPHEIEKIFIPQMKKILLSIDSSLEIIEVDHEQLPKVI